MNNLVTHIGQPVFDIHLDALRSCDAGLTHSTGHHGRMGGLAAAAGEYSLRREESVDVFRLGLLTDQEDLFPLLSHCLGGVRVEYAFS